MFLLLVPEVVVLAHDPNLDGLGDVNELKQLKEVHTFGVLCENGAYTK